MMSSLDYRVAVDNSANMAQYATSRQEFMTSEPGIEYQRGGGFFLSHRKIAIFITVIFLSLVAVGFVGAYVGATPRKKVFDATALIAGDAGSEPADAAKYKLSNSIFPSHYFIDLLPIIDDNGITWVRGRVVINFHYNDTSNLSKIILNAKGMNVTNIKMTSGFIKNHTRQQRDVQNTTAQFLNETTIKDDNSTIESSTIPANISDSQEEMPRTIEIKNNEIDNEHGILTIDLASEINSGLYTLDINYETHVDNRTLLIANFSDESADRWLMASQLKPINARRLFPVFDDVKLKAKFILSVNHSADTTVLSNSPLKSRTITPTGLAVDVFEETPPISPHNLAFIQGQLMPLGKIMTNDTKNLTINFWGQWSENLDPSYLKDSIILVINYFEELFKVNLTMNKLDVVSVPFSINSANPGLITIREPFFNVTKVSPGVTRYETLRTLIRLIGQQWLGGLVNSQNWTDVWILESSLIDIQHEIIQKIDPSFNHSTFLLDVQLEAFEADGYSVSQSLDTKVNPTYLDAFHPDELYDRGACLLRMMHGALRHNETTTGYRKFVSSWIYDNADVSSFLEAMTDNSTALPDGTTPIEAINSWIGGHGYPLLTIDRNYDEQTATVRQSRFTFDNLTNDHKKPWYLPLTWIKNNNDTSSPSFMWIKPSDDQTLINEMGDNNTWLIFNINSIGYYRINYDKYNWQLIANALIENPTIFPSSVKASLIDDVLSLAFVGKTTYLTAFSIINYLQNESQPEPWSALMGHAIKLNLVLSDTAAYPSYQQFMRKLSSNLFNEFGLQIDAGKRMTLIAHQLGSAFESTEYVDWVKKNSVDLKNSYGWKKRYVVPSYLRESLLCTLAKLEDELGWQWWKDKLGNITKRDNDRNSFLSSLACFQVSWMLQAVLNEIVEGSFFENDESLVILKEFNKHPAASEVAFKYVQTNWPKILTRFEKSYPILRAFIGTLGSGFTTEKDLIDFQNFRESNYDSLKPVGYITAFVEAKGNSWVSFLNNSFVDFDKTIRKIVEIVN
ncbi:aminopeptidase N-like isoform X2 [Aphidius gifuensis]|uniref:aminopeptidase N-like isoform X2 n=1 Tax=Aphidius gifuensis TaxID=684658 RepID=UPI001CDB53C1|nr:aminopeptidase N-like isoform X2 [Aphidius gifuensis]